VLVAPNGDPNADAIVDVDNTRAIVRRRSSA
jgi:hypothetical protein